MDVSHIVCTGNSFLIVNCCDIGLITDPVLAHTSLLYVISCISLIFKVWIISAHDLISTSCSSLMLQVREVEETVGALVEASMNEVVLLSDVIFGPFPLTPVRIPPLASLLRLQPVPSTIVSSVHD